MNHLERALGRAKNEMNLTEAEEASLKQALEWKMGEGKRVRIPEDYRHQAWWRGLALVLPLIVIFVMARQAKAPENKVIVPETTDLKTEMFSVPVAEPQRVILKQEIVLPPSAPSSAGSMMLMSATSTATTSVEKLPKEDYNNQYEKI